MSPAPPLGVPGRDVVVDGAVGGHLQGGACEQAAVGANVEKGVFDNAVRSETISRVPTERYFSLRHLRVVGRERLRTHLLDGLEAGLEVGLVHPLPEGVGGAEGGVLDVGRGGEGAALLVDDGVGVCSELCGVCGGGEGGRGVRRREQEREGLSK